ncbi:uncharacterized protein [Pituophis catenifer annectens]|uniref:uncharacterized protein n=1 Tax=Pituophis catenifer annectens TaxID=94852 RepID=UPI003996C041
MDFTKFPDYMEGLGDRFMKCTVESGTRPNCEANFKVMLHMPPDGLQEKTGHVAHEVDQQWKRRNCTKGAFNVIATTGSMKLRKRRTNLTHKLSDSGGRFWEEFSIHLDHTTSFSKYSRHQNANVSVTDLIEELKIEDQNSLSALPAVRLPSTESPNDIDMQPTSDLQTANEMMNLPQRYSRTAEPSTGLGAFTDAAGLIPDHPLLMDVEFSESEGLTSTPAVAPLPLLAGSDGDIVMHDETMIRKSKGIPILERVGETLRQKKLRVTQA